MTSFSERYGYRELPPQLKLGEISDNFRERIKLACDRFLKGYTYDAYLDDNGETLFQDYFVKVLRKKPEPINVSYAVRIINTVTLKGKFWAVFDFIEFLAKETNDGSFIKDITQAFIDERLAYRFKDGEVIAVGTEEQAETIGRAFESLENNNFNSASTHLKKASRLLAESDFAGSGKFLRPHVFLVPFLCL